MKVTICYKKCTNPPKYPTISTLYEIVIDDSSPSNNQADRYKPHPDKDSIALFRNSHTNLALIGCRQNVTKQLHAENLGLAKYFFIKQCTVLEKHECVAEKTYIPKVQ